MKKIMMLAAMLAMVLVAAAPALAQDDATSVTGDAAIDNSVSIQDTDIDTDICSNFVQGQYVGGDLIIGEDGSNSVVNQCVAAGFIAVDDVHPDVVVHDDEFVVGADSGASDSGASDSGASASASSAASSSASSAASDDSATMTVAEVSAPESSGSTASVAAAPAPSASVASGGVLPDTGGASLLAAGAGALLVAGGLLARRIIR